MPRARRRMFARHRRAHRALAALARVLARPQRLYDASRVSLTINGHRIVPFDPRKAVRGEGV